MIKRVARCIREYKWPAILSPLAMIGEVAMEVLIPLSRWLWPASMTTALCARICRSW